MDGSSCIGSRTEMMNSHLARCAGSRPSAPPHRGRRRIPRPEAPPCLHCRRRSDRDTLPIRVREGRYPRSRQIMEREIMRLFGTRETDVRVGFQKPRQGGGSASWGADDRREPRQAIHVEPGVFGFPARLHFHGTPFAAIAGGFKRWRQDLLNGERLKRRSAPEFRQGWC
jgi:hypothetical protein